MWGRAVGALEPPELGPFVTHLTTVIVSILLYHEPTFYNHLDEEYHNQTNKQRQGAA